jgi:radical SAM-linked protein
MEVPLMSSDATITRIRVHYAKGESLRFTGHLDLQRIWERTLRRSRLPVRYSQGYHPRARLNLASALPLGFVSDCELLDFWLDEAQPLDEIQAKLTTSAPPGLTIQAVQMVDLSEKALQEQMKASEFIVDFFDTQDAVELERKAENILAQVEINHLRRKKTYNLRSLILDLQVITDPAGDPGLWMKMLAEPGATGRPDDLLDELGYTNTDYLVRRTNLILA